MKHSELSRRELSDAEVLRRAAEELDRKPTALWAAYLCMFLLYVMLWCLMQ